MERYKDLHLRHRVVQTGCLQNKTRQLVHICGNSHLVSGFRIHQKYIHGHVYLKMEIKNGANRTECLAAGWYPSSRVEPFVTSVLRSGLVRSWTPFLGGPGPGPVLQISEKGRTEDWTT